MNADSSQAADMFCWLEDTGDIYRYVSSEWVQPISAGFGYYLEKVIPRSLRATIHRVDGNDLILSTDAVVDADDANVYFDNAPAFNIARNANPGGDFVWPAGTFAIGSSLDLVGSAQTGATISGAGQDETTIKLPLGLAVNQPLLNNIATMIAVYHGAEDVIVSDLTIQSNAFNQGYMVNTRSETEFSAANGYHGGIFFTESDNGLMRDATARDTFSFGFGTENTEGVWARDCKVIITDPLLKYIQWQFQWVASTGGTEDCEVDSNYIIAGMETFNSIGTQFIRPVMRNAVFSFNNAGGWLLDEPVVVTEALCQFTQAFSSFNNVVSVNANFGSTNTESGGTINNPIITQEGYINAANDTFRTIVINATCPNVTVNGGLITLPDYAEPSELFGPVGLDSTGESTNVDGLTVIGTPKPGYPNISVSNGSVTNCTAEVIDGP